jgi:tetratricopeptide (TPR) repeat protein
LCLVLVVISLSGVGQNMRKIDSLNQLFPTADPIGKINILRDVAFEYYDIDDQTMLAYIDRAIPLADSISDSLEIVKLNRLRGQLLRITHRNEESVKVLDKMLPIAERNRFSNEVGYIFTALSVAHAHLANYDKALKYAFRSLAICKDSQEETSNALMNIGAIHYKIGNYEKALTYYYKALDIKAKNNIRSSQEALNLNISLCYCYGSLRNSKKAIEYIKAAYAICGTNCSDATKLRGEFGHGVVAFNEFEWGASELHFKKSLELSLKVDNKRFVAENELYLGRIEMVRGKAKKAKQYFENVIRIAEAGGYNQLRLESYGELSKFKKSRKDYFDAVNYQEKYINLHDSIWSEKVRANIMATQLEFEDQQNAMIILADKKRIEYEQTRASFIGAISVLLGLLALVLTLAILNKKRINRRLDLKVKERTIELEFSRDLLRKSITDQAVFFNKAMRDIKAPLATIDGIWVAATMESESDEKKKYLEGLKGATNEMNSLIKRLTLINGMHTKEFGRQKVDLISVLREAIEVSIAEFPSIKISLREPSEPIFINSLRSLLLCLMRALISEEATRGKASEINLFVEVSSEYLQLMICSNRIDDFRPDLVFARSVAKSIDVEIINEERAAGAPLKVRFSRQVALTGA